MPRYVPIQPHLWGPQHFHVLFLAEEAAVHNKGRLDSGLSETRGPTHLSDGSTLERHSDTSCLLDLELCQYLQWRNKQGNCPIITILPAAWPLVGAIRAWLAGGGTTTTFKPTPDQVKRVPRPDPV